MLYPTELRARRATSVHRPTWRLRVPSGSTSTCDAAPATPHCGADVPGPRANGVPSGSITSRDPVAHVAPRNTLPDEKSWVAQPCAGCAAGLLLRSDYRIRSTIGVVPGKLAP